MLNTELLRIVIVNTKTGPHKDAVLGLLKSNMSRFAAEIKNITCDRCGDMIEAVRWTGTNRQIVDSWGYMEFDDEVVCHRCLHEGYFGDIYLPSDGGAA